MMCRVTALAVGVLALAFLAGCGRGGREGKIEDLFVSSERHVIDKDAGQVRVYGQLENTGQGRFRQVAVYAVLRSAGGESRGENNLILENIQPLEKRLFALTVTSHDRVAAVDLQVRKPENP